MTNGAVNGSRNGADPAVAGRLPIEYTTSTTTNESAQRSTERTEPQVAATPNLVARIMRFIVEGLERRRTADELRRLSPHLQLDIGIEPGDIDAVAARLVAEKTGPTRAWEPV